MIYKNREIIGLAIREQYNNIDEHGKSVNYIETYGDGVDNTYYIVLNRDANVYLDDFIEENYCDFVRYSSLDDAKKAIDGLDGE